MLRRLPLFLTLALLLGLAACGSSGSMVTVNNPNPTLSAITPTSATAGSGAFTLTLTGSGYIAASQVQWNGSNRTTTFVSSTQLTAAILASDVASSGTASVTVVNPSPGGGTSAAQTFQINTSTNP